MIEQWCDVLSNQITVFVTYLAGSYPVQEGQGKAMVVVLPSMLQVYVATFGRFKNKNESWKQLWIKVYYFVGR